MIAIRPFDKSSLKVIEKAILASDLGLTPNNDGQIIRLNIPPLTQERRNELQSSSTPRGRSARRRAEHSPQRVDDIREFEREKLISEDDSKRGQEDIQKLTDKYIEKVEAAGRRKEQEIKEI